MAEPPPGWIDRWDHNRAGCYETEAAAVATIPLEEQASYVLFAYRLIPFVGDTAAPMPATAAEHLFDPSLPALPEFTAPVDYVRLGYDVVSVGAMTRSFECSPLSCNGLAAEIPVNRYCLLDDVADAQIVARRFEIEQPESGRYVVVEVLARRTDLSRLTVAAG